MDRKMYRKTLTFTVIRGGHWNQAPIYKSINLATLRKDASSGFVQEAMMQEARESNTKKLVKEC